ncbi:hypothetical protein BU26DRAFT_568458 [Trematosphaeria pertusa]|uniref:Uncharacterized protein n=1 Tax=Trematosphaeria pertusa TaxID=390896 RepID=A0A6A6I4K2_9PLEO|nr:uncharacterized protein BU26DRAFT_568458 [Trematosphaeria pertusa]KAF2245159.1 hypothetical protein BU26DRAFT_568458 [Trematosphaeria pertusa]
MSIRHRLVSPACSALDHACPPNKVARYQSFVARIGAFYDPCLRVSPKQYQLAKDQAFVRKERRRLHQLLRQLLNNPNPVKKRWARDLAVYHDNLLALVRQIHIDNMGHVD